MLYGTCLHKDDASFDLGLEVGLFQLQNRAGLHLLSLYKYWYGTTELHYLLEIYIQATVLYIGLKKLIFLSYNFSSSLYTFAFILQTLPSFLVSTVSAQR
jgi:hypothetical protein